MKKLFLLALPATLLKNEASKCNLDIKIPISHFVTDIGNFNYDIYLSPSELQQSNLTLEERFGTFEAKNVNCLGAMSFILNDTIQNRKITGKLINSPDTFKRRITIVDPITGDEYPRIETYFEPLEDSTWIFQDFNLNISDTVHFDKGRKPGKW